LFSYSIPFNGFEYGSGVPAEPYGGGLLLAGLELLFDAFASLRRKPLWKCRARVFLALMSSRTQEFQLAPISAAPFADKQM